MLDRRVSPGGYPPTSPWTVGAVLLGGIVAGAIALAALILAQEAEGKYAFAALGVAVFLVTLPLTGNARLTCVYVILLFAPFVVRMTFLRVPHMGGAGALIIDLIDPLLLMLLAFQLRDRVQGIRRYRFPLALVLWAALIGLGVVSVLLGPLRTLAAIETFRMAKLLLLALLLTNEIVRLSHFRHAIIALTLGVILQAGVALLQYAKGSQLGLHFLGESSTEDILALSAATYLDGDLAYRVDGLMGHSNLLAGYLALYLPMMVALLLAPVSRWLKAMLAVGLLVGQPALVLTLSRAGWIDFLVAFAIVLVLGAVHPVSRRKFLAARLLLVGMTSAVVIALSPAIVERIFESDPNAVQMRFEWLQTAWAMIVDNPVLGVGLNAYVFAQVPYGKDKTPEDMTERYGDHWPAVHNSWALVWTEQGTLGFLLWIGVHAAVIAVGIRNLRIRDPMLHALSVGLLAGIVAIMVDGLASFFVRTEAPARMFWIAIGLLLAIGEWRRRNESTAAAPRAASESPGVPSRPAGGRWLPYRESVLR